MGSSLKLVEHTLRFRLTPRTLELRLEPVEGGAAVVPAAGGGGAAEQQAGDADRVAGRAGQLDRPAVAQRQPVAGREHGVRLYEPAGPPREPGDPPERLRRLVLVIAALLAPVSDTSLRAALQLFARGSPSLPGWRSVVSGLLAAGDLQSAEVDGIRYVWPAGRVTRGTPAEAVRFLAPFDPVVWDRRRFEHLWGWPYRFEAYTPPAKRRMGYYAMPLLWRDDVVGWVNISNLAGNFRVQEGFVHAAPDAAGFRDAFETEVDRFRTFLAMR
jgi:uncharacterized protein YcaQ